MKNHWAVSDYLQRSARHIASQTDLLHAEAVGVHAVRYAVKGMNGVMPVIVRGKGEKYSWKILPVSLSKIANVEKKLPNQYRNDTPENTIKNDIISHIARGSLASATRPLDDSLEVQITSDGSRREPLRSLG